MREEKGLQRLVSSDLIDAIPLITREKAPEIFYRGINLTGLSAFEACFALALSLRRSNGAARVAGCRTSSYIMQIGNLKF